MNDTTEMPRDDLAASVAANRARRAHRRQAPKISTMVCPPEKHISVQGAELAAAIKNRLELADRGLFDELCKLMAGVSEFDFFDLKVRIRANFLPFTSGAKHQLFLQRNSKSLPTTVSLDKKEEEFIADVYEVLLASHYHLLTTGEWDIATGENFQLNLPITINWNYMETEMLSKFWCSNPERAALRAQLPDEMSDRILVFHRGIGTQKLSGMLIDAKLDLLIDYTLVRLVDMVVALLPKSKKPAAKTPAQVELEKKRATMAELAAKANPDNQLLSASMKGGTVSGSQYIASTHKYAKVVERNTLKRQCPTLLSLLKAFPKTMELQEPTFKDIVVLYRKAYPPRKAPSSQNKVPTKSKEERMQGILNYRNIHIKVFGEIAMADIEMIFPEKKLGIKPFNMLNLVVTVVTALVAGAMTLLKAGTDINTNVVWTALSLVLTRCFQVYSTAQTEKAVMQQSMSAQLYDKMQDSQEGVISNIMEEMAAQQFKQMLCAYMMLIIKAKNMSVEELDDTIEDFLVRDFDHKIDFQVEDALPRLLRWGLVIRTSQGKVEAIPLPDAIQTLQAAWSTAYSAIGTSNGSTRDMITGQGSAFGAGLDAFHASKARQVEEAAVASAEATRKNTMSGKISDMRSRLTGQKSGAAPAASGGSVTGMAPASSMAQPSPATANGGPNGSDGGMQPSRSLTPDESGSMARASSGDSSTSKKKKGFLKKLLA